MNNIKLITAPDIVFDQATSIVVVCPGANLKTELQYYLESITRSTNVYLYETRDIEWLLTVSNIADYVLVDIDNCDSHTSHFLSYILSLPNTYYKCEHMQIEWNLLNKNRFYNFPDHLKDTNER